MKKIFCIMLCLVTLPAFAAEPDEKQKIIIEIMKVSKTDTLMDQTLAAVVQALLIEEKRKNPNITESFIQLVTDTMNEAMAPFKEEVIYFMISFMDKNFTTDELQTMLEYQKTQAGQKALSLMPQMMAQLQVMVQQKMPEIMMDFKANLAKKVAPVVKNES